MGFNITNHTDSAPLSSNRGKSSSSGSSGFSFPSPGDLGLPPSPPYHFKSESITYILSTDAKLSLDLATLTNMMKEIIEAASRRLRTMGSDLIAALDPKSPDPYLKVHPLETNRRFFCFPLWSSNKGESNSEKKGSLKSTGSTKSTLGKSLMSLFSKAQKAADDSIDPSQAGQNRRSSLICSVLFEGGNEGDGRKNPNLVGSAAGSASVTPQTRSARATPTIVEEDGFGTRSFSLEGNMHQNPLFDESDSEEEGEEAIQNEDDQVEKEDFDKVYEAPELPERPSIRKNKEQAKAPDQTYETPQSFEDTNRGVTEEDLIDKESNRFYGEHKKDGGYLDVEGGSADQAGNNGNEVIYQYPISKGDNKEGLYAVPENQQFQEADATDATTINLDKQTSAPHMEIKRRVPDETVESNELKNPLLQGRTLRDTYAAENENAQGALDQVLKNAGTMSVEEMSHCIQSVLKIDLNRAFKYFEEDRLADFLVIFDVLQKTGANLALISAELGKRIEHCLRENESKELEKLRQLEDQLEQISNQGDGDLLDQLAKKIRQHLMVAIKENKDFVNHKTFQYFLTSQDDTLFNANTYEEQYVTNILDKLDPSIKHPIRANLSRAKIFFEKVCSDVTQQLKASQQKEIEDLKNKQKILEQEKEEILKNFEELGDQLESIEHDIFDLNDQKGESNEKLDKQIEDLGEKKVNIKNQMNVLTRSKEKNGQKINALNKRMQQSQLRHDYEVTSLTDMLRAVYQMKQRNPMLEAAKSSEVLAIEIDYIDEADKAFQ